MKLGHENKTFKCIPQILLKHMNLKKLGLDLRFVKFNYDNWLVKLGHLSLIKNKTKLNKIEFWLMKLGDKCKTLECIPQIDY
jgi:hypothetical protein